MSDTYKVKNLAGNIQMMIQNFIINSLEPTDTNQLYQFITDNSKRFQRYFPVTLANNSTIEKTTAYIITKKKEIAERTTFTYTIRNNNNKEIAGLIILKKIDWDKKQGEFAYCIGSQFGSKGLASFAVKEMIKFAFDKLGLETLQIISHKTNLESVKVAEKNDFIWKRTLLKEFTPTNEAALDMELYELYNEK